MKITMTSITHNGPVFPAEYVARGFKVANETLPELAEEMLYDYARKSETEYVKKPIFNKNFWSCLKPELTSAQKKLSFPADFQTVIAEMKKTQADVKAQKDLIKTAAKNGDASAKKILDDEKAAKTALKEKHATAILNGNPAPLNGYMIEEPGIIITRGANPRLGLWKYRTQPEDVTINFVDPTGTMKAPEAPLGHKWKAVVSTPSSAYAFKYKVKNGPFEINKAVRFAAGSEIAETADKTKYENGEKLLKIMPKIEKHIADGFKSSDPKRQQAALITYLCKLTAIRIGNEQSEETAAMTEGLSTLKVGSVTLRKE